VISLLASVVVAVLAAAGPADVHLDVPYLPQTDLLCGGAAAAMVFRYWGDLHADAAPFAPLSRCGVLHITAATADVYARLRLHLKHKEVDSKPRLNDGTLRPVRQ